MAPKQTLPRTDHPWPTSVTRTPPLTMGASSTKKRTSVPVEILKAAMSTRAADAIRRKRREGTLRTRHAPWRINEQMVGPRRRPTDETRQRP